MEKLKWVFDTDSDEVGRYFETVEEAEAFVEESDSIVGISLVDNGYGLLFHTYGEYNGKVLRQDYIEE